MTTFVLGTAGHVDHGKTSLVRALTGTDTDRLREEKERGLTIDLGFAKLAVGGGQASIVDVPGHRDFIGNMLAGSTGVDAVLLVISAAEGPMPQTIEHLQIARVLGIDHGVVALSHADVVDPEFADLAEEAAREVLDAVLPGRAWPIVRVDSLSGAGLDGLRAALDTMAAQLPAPAADPVFRMPVDRSFVIDGTGTVVTGTVWSGSATVGDSLRALPDGDTVRVRSLQAHGEEVATLGPRSRGAVALVGVSAAEVRRGSTLVGGDWAPTSRVGVRARLLPDAPRILEHGLRLRIWVGTREVMGRIHLEDRAPLTAGDTGFAVLDLEAPLVVRSGDRCVLRFYSPVELLGGAEIAEVDPPAKWASRVALWGDVLDAPAGLARKAALELAGPAGARADDLHLRIPVRTAHGTGASPADRGRPASAGSPITIGERLYHPRYLEQAREHVLAWLASAHEGAPRRAGVPLQELRSTAAASLDLVEHAVGRLLEEGRVAREGPLIRLAGHAVRLTSDEESRAARLDGLLEAAGFASPSVADLAATIGASAELIGDLLRIGLDDGRYVQVTPDFYLTAAKARELEAVVTDVFASSDLAGPGDFRDRLGVTRRHLIPLLEFLDAGGWTRRVPGGRVPGDRLVGSSQSR